MFPLRENVEHVFDCFCEVPMPASPEDRLVARPIRLKFPDEFDKTDILNRVPSFAYPCAVESLAVEHFSFVLFIENRWLFGFCRRSPSDRSTLVMLSALPWHDVMFRLLDSLHQVLSDGGDDVLRECLQTVYSAPVPSGGETLRLPLPDGTEFTAECPDERQLPALLVDRNLTEYWTMVKDEDKLELFAALLHERHVLVTSAKLSRLSACVQAAQSLLYPLHWQRIFLPVVPAPLKEMLASPPAFLAGCPAAVRALLRPSDLPDGCVELDADHKRLITQHADLQKLPADVVTLLRRQLKMAETGPADAVARAFQTAVFKLVEGYQHGIRRGDDGKPTFDREAFLLSQPSSRRPFLNTLVNTQMFEQFIEERLSRPDFSGDSLLRQPSAAPLPPLPRRPLLGRLTGAVGRRRLLSGGIHGPEQVTDRRGMEDRRGSTLGGGASSRSAPASPASQRLRMAGPSAPCLQLAGARQLPGAGPRRMTNADVNYRPEEDPLADFSISENGSMSLMDEINAELDRMHRLSVQDAADAAAAGAAHPVAAPSNGGGGDSESDSVFTGDASGRGAGPPRPANGHLPGSAGAAGKRGRSRSEQDHL